MKKTLFTLLMIFSVAIAANAQTWDDAGSDSWGDASDDQGAADYQYDQGSGSVGSYTDSTAGTTWGNDDGTSWGSGSDNSSAGYGQEYVRAARPTAEAKPYERFTGMPFDSASRLVTYVEIVEVIVPDRFLDLGGMDYSVADSLYARAMEWMQKEFGKKEAKQMIENAGVDPKGKEGQTIKAHIVMPLVVETNKYAKTTVGVIKFDMELRFKDERYRYKFDNFVHVTPNAVGKEEISTYMEYYMTSKKDVRNNDKILMACNSQMNRLIGELKATCSSVPYIDDDEW
jgi:hypothetical protein